MATKRPFRESLQLFNQKAALLQQRSFIKDMLKGKTGYSMKMQVNTIEVERHYSDDEVIDATTNTCRYFLEPRDGCSFDQLAPYYADPSQPVAHDVRDEFKSHHVDLNRFLGSQSSIAGMNYLAILYTIIYGDIAHSNPVKVDVVSGWKKAGPMFEAAYADFVKTMAAVVVKAITVQPINAKAIAQLSA